MSQNIPATMQAMLLTGHGGYNNLEFVKNHPVPVPQAREVLIQVHACGLNNTDINTRVGWYSKGVTSSTNEDAQGDADDGDSGWGGAGINLPRIQGADVTGTVVALGAGAKETLLNRRVLVDTWVRDWNKPHDKNKPGYIGSECDGGFAQYVKTDERNVYPVNTDLSHAELATFATSYSTAEHMLSRANVNATDTVLVTGASGGVGSALIQLAHRRGANVVALCGDEKRDLVASLGPLAVLPRSPENLAAALNDAIGSTKVSVVADVVGGELFGQLIDVLERGGRYACSGAIAGPIVALDLRTLYLNDLTFVGTTIEPPGLFAELVSYIEKGEIRPLLAKTFALKDLVEAQRMFVAKKHLGNIVVEP
ncbi:MAG: alcohol dehydrogenase family protein [Gammaproteobacteria bacterium]